MMNVLLQSINFVLPSMSFVLKTRDFVSKTMKSLFIMMNSAAPWDYVRGLLISIHFLLIS